VAPVVAIRRGGVSGALGWVLSGDQHPDHDSISHFRKRHLKALGAPVAHVLVLCQKAGLVKLVHVAIDGTKMAANASKHKAMSYGRMGEAEKKLLLGGRRAFACGKSSAGPPS
jgi:hypothetical protein